MMRGGMIIKGLGTQEKHEPKMIDSLGKMPTQYHIKHFICEEYRMRTMFKIQEVSIVENMGIKMPRIYVALDNIQV